MEARASLISLPGLQPACPVLSGMFSPMVHPELSPSLADTPLVCDKGSKTSLMGEDGEVSLDCGFVRVHAR